MYAYYAVFTYEDDGITITFHDLPGCISCGYSTDEALHLYLDDMSEADIPNPSPATKIVMEGDNQKLFKITVEVNQ